MSELLKTNNERKINFQNFLDQRGRVFVCLKYRFCLIPRFFYGISELSRQGRHLCLSFYYHPVFGKVSFFLLIFMFMSSIFLLLCIFYVMIA